MRSEAGSGLPGLVSHDTLIPGIHEQRILARFLAQSLLKRYQSRPPVLVARLLKRADPLLDLRFRTAAQHVPFLVLVAKRDAERERALGRRVYVDAAVLQNDDAGGLPPVDVPQLVDVEVEQQIAPQLEPTFLER